MDTEDVVKILDQFLLGAFVYVQGHPEATARELYEHLDDEMAEITQSAVMAKCKHCGLPIRKYPGAQWLHVPPGEARCRGCRAASYVKDVGWTHPEYPRSWMATPIAA